MPKDTATKLDECLEIIDKGIFDDWQRGFLRSMKKRLAMNKPITGPMQEKIDECYVAACRSPY